MVLNTAVVITFILVLIRVTTFVVSAPFFSMPMIPGRVKLGLALALTVAVFPSVAGVSTNVPGGIWGYVLAAFSEAGVGLGLGFSATLVFSAITLAGQYMDLQIGFAAASLLNPSSGLNVTLLAQYLYFLAMVIYLNMDGHLVLIADLARSYQLVPLSAAGFGLGATQQMIRIFAEMFVLAIQIAAPLVTVLLVAELVLGFLGRTAPQMNVFMLSFPLNIAVGLLVLGIILPMLATFFTHVFDVMNGQVMNLMRGLT
ncbi:MAG TPA: flagellar biosynthetic protein FliR [Spirochaetia bacterium]|nr:flagellar biosynthetic protein FliR [Spirochaetia bacterium]